MTTLIAWTSYDQRRFAALHVASDSRITWASKEKRWDAGRKIFASRTTADIWAYCGDVLFPSLVLGQIVSAADAGMLFNENTAPSERNRVTVDAIQSSFNLRHNAPDHDFCILHASRQGHGATAIPLLWQLTFDARKARWTNEQITLPSITAVAVVNGSGKTSTNTNLKRWKESDIGGTSRSIYGAFAEAIDDEKNELSGGPAQLASIYPKGGARTAGTVFENNLYLHGLPIKISSPTDEIKWFDNQFQIIDPITMELSKGAARQPKPKLRDK